MSTISALFFVNLKAKNVVKANPKIEMVQFTIERSSKFESVPKNHSLNKDITEFIVLAINNKENIKGKTLIIEIPFLRNINIGPSMTEDKNIDAKKIQGRIKRLMFRPFSSIVEEPLIISIKVSIEFCKIDNSSARHLLFQTLKIPHSFLIS